MTQEEKQLLFQDLCARFPHGVKIHIEFNEIAHIVGDATLDSIKSITGQLFDFCDFEQDFNHGDDAPICGLSGSRKLHITEFKPYLRPMSSMTEEEKKEYDILTPIVEVVFPCDAYPLIDWLNKKMLDYRGLIEKGLALEAPKDMYNIKIQGNE